MADNRPCLIAVTLATFLIALAADTDAVGPSTPRSLADTTQRNGKQSQPPTAEIDRDTEAVALNLVDTHLPELKSVMQRLRADEPRQYARAVADLARSAKKLEIARNRDQSLYEIEAEMLKAQNAASLLTAKLKVRDSESDRQRLRRAVSRLQQAQVARAQYEVESLRARIKRTEQQLENAQQRLQARREGLDQELEKSYIAALKKAGRQAVSDSPRPAAAEPPATNRPVTKKPVATKSAGKQTTLD